MFSVTKTKDLHAVIILILVEVRIQIDFLHFLPERKQLAESELYLLVPQIKIKAPAAITLVGSEVI